MQSTPPGSPRLTPAAYRAWRDLYDAFELDGDYNKVLDATLADEAVPLYMKKAIESLREIPNTSDDWRKVLVFWVFFLGAKGYPSQDDVVSHLGYSTVLYANGLTDSAWTTAPSACRACGVDPKGARQDVRLCPGHPRPPRAHAAVARVVRVSPTP